MSKTRAEIQFKTLAILVGGLDAAPSAEDAETIDGYIDGQVAELNSDGTIYIDDADELADELFTAFCHLVANAAADEFGGASDERKAQMYRNRIRVIVRPAAGYGPQQVDYY